MASTSKESQQSLQGILPEPLPLSFLQEITENFESEELGHSVFGTVYKGTLPDGRIVSVKKLDENAPVAHVKTFATEVTNLMALKHKNIVELVGSCQETSKKVIQHNGRYVNQEVTESFLCYEYLAKGSLNKYIYTETDTINWDVRFKIVKGICYGLHFLHKDLPIGPLIHMNLVPNNIWLDDNWEPKIADFGLSRLIGQQQTQKFTSNVRGHYGYMAPEYPYKGVISTQLDIYSLGMLILEITTGKKNDATDADKSARNFVEKVRREWKTDEQIQSKYPLLVPKGLQQGNTCIVIGLKCVDVERKRRPSIVDIVDRLNGKRVAIFEEE